MSERNKYMNISGHIEVNRDKYGHGWKREI